MPPTATAAAVAVPDRDPHLTVDEELAAYDHATHGRRHPMPAGYCEVCHAPIGCGDLCPTCERADEGLR